MSYTDQDFEKTAASHTPGPWRLELERIGLRQDSDAFIWGPKGGEEGYIARVNLLTLRGPEDEAARLANARLIAAAPDLLAALKALRHQCDYMGAPADHPDMLAAVTAIAKATGREP